jgi:hypothetical protein
LLFDLKVMRHGMKGQVIAYTGAQHQCLGCNSLPDTFFLLNDDMELHRNR